MSNEEFSFKCLIRKIENLPFLFTFLFRGSQNQKHIILHNRKLFIKKAVNIQIIRILTVYCQVLIFIFFKLFCISWA